MDRRQAPADNVWVPGHVGIDAAVGAIADYFTEHAPERYADRATVVHNKSDVDFYEGELAQFVANGNVGSLRGNGGNRGGPVLVLESDLRLLEHAIKLADGQLLGVIEHVPESLEGWAAAVHALDLSTGERHAGVPGDVHELLLDLKREGNNGYGSLKKPSAYATMTKLYIGQLKESGYDGAFVAGYLLGLGISWKSAENLEKIYE